MSSVAAFPPPTALPPLVPNLRRFSVDEYQHLREAGVFI